MTFEIPMEPTAHKSNAVELGATVDHGGTRKSVVKIGGSNCLPFHLFEGDAPHRPVIAMEVFDAPPKRYPQALMDYYGDVLEKPGDMAKKCVDEYGAELISVRLEGTHPDKGNKSPEEAVEVVKQVVQSVDVPLIITGHSHFEKNNQVMLQVAEATAGENCLMNWVEKDNYKTVAAGCLAHGHCIVAQSPIDVNIAKQLNIQLNDLSFPPEKIVMDSLSSAVGYGLEYTYSIMERIRLDALGGDVMLNRPIMATPGYESAQSKEAWAPETDNPEWGKEELRTAIWEIATAMSILIAGADLLIMYHPVAADVVRKKIGKLAQAKIV